MHYRNGREAKNGDKIVQVGGYGGGEEAEIVALGVLYDATPGNDYCNGSIAPIQSAATGACMCDCLHVDDVAKLLKGFGDFSFHTCGSEPHQIAVFSVERGDPATVEEIDGLLQRLNAPSLAKRPPGK